MSIRFSVLVPVYNRAGYVRQALDSALSQASADDEVLVIDDGSTDQTPQVLESYGTCIQVIRQSNRGPEVARNTGAASARGEYLVLLDSDDLLLPGALAAYDQIIRAFDSPPLIFGAMTFFRNGQPVPASAPVPCPVQVLKYRDYLSKDVPFHMSASRIVIRRSLFHSVGGFRNSSVASFHMDDFNFMLNAGTYGPFILVQKPYTVGYRLHETNSMSDTRGMAEGILGLVRSERQGQYPGGNRRRAARYTCIGGLAASFAFLHCWRGGSRKLALRLLAESAPMVLAAARSKFLRGLRKPTQPIVLPLSPASTPIGRLNSEQPVPGRFGRQLDEASGTELPKSGTLG